ncbi:MAG: hypothetical protein OJF47_003830 [Nitrospira sp.]|nr:MAG: hypothetical protein OJF47_003830 [Nitrospira sp.]
MIDRRSPPAHRLLSLITLVLVVSSLTTSLRTVRAQPTSGDVFSSDSGTGKTWWDVKRRDYPSCADLGNL